MTKDLNKMNDNRSKGGNKSRKRRKNQPIKEEKTIRITKQADFVQREEFHGAEEPMPNVTFREIKRKQKAAQKAAEREREEQERELKRQAEESRSRITLSSSEDNAAENAEDSAARAESSAEQAENVEAETAEKPKKAKKDKKAKKEKAEKSDNTEETEAEEEASNVTDIRAARKKEKNKKRVKKIVAVGIVAVFGASVFATKDLWVPKLEGILDKPHATIINDGKKESGNFPISFDESSVNVIKLLTDSIVRVDDRHIVFYDEAGEEVTDNSHNFANPVVKTSGKRALVYDNGGKSFEVLNKKGELLSKDIDQSILLAEISPDSSVAVVTQTEKYPAVMTVYDSTGAEIFQWCSSARILSISFTENGSGCYISTFSSKGGTLRSVIHYVSFDSTEELMKSQPLETLAVAVSKNDNGDYWVVGDTCFYKLDSSGQILLQYEYPGELKDYSLSGTTASVVFKGIQRKTGTLAIFRSDSDDDKPSNVVYTQSGLPKKMTAYNKKIILLSEDNIEAYDSSGNLLATAAVSSEYIDFAYLNDSVYFLGLREINKIAFDT